MWMVSLVRNNMACNTGYCTKDHLSSFHIQQHSQTRYLMQLITGRQFSFKNFHHSEVGTAKLFETPNHTYYKWEKSLQLDFDSTTESFSNPLSTFKSRRYTGQVSSEYLLLNSMLPTLFYIWWHEQLSKTVPASPISSSNPTQLPC